MGTATYRHLDLAHLKVRGGEPSMLSAPTASLPTKNRTRSPMALQMNSMGPVDIQVKTIHVERDRQSVVLELLYARHETDLTRATSWYRTLWQESNPHETYTIKVHRPILKDMGATLRRRRESDASGSKSKGYICSYAICKPELQRGRRNEIVNVHKLQESLLEAQTQQNE